jgi:ankyrin repeat protein
MIALTAAAIHYTPVSSDSSKGKSAPDRLVDIGIPVKFASAIHAAKKDDILVLSLLAESGIDLDHIGANGLPLVATAIRSGSPKATEWLLSRKPEAKPDANAAPDPATEAEAEQYGPTEMSPLDHAVAASQPEMVSRLVDRSSRLQINRALARAVRKSNLQSAALLLRAGADPDHAEEGLPSLLEIALASSDDKLISTLLEAGASPHPALLQLAADRRDLSSLRMLAEHGAPIDCPDADGDTALTLAVRQNDLELAQCLLDLGASTKARGRVGQAALPLAVALRAPKMVDLLLESGADPNIQLATPVSKPFLTLVDNKTMNFYLTRDSRFTPLMIAAAIDEAGSIRTLLKHGANRGTYTRDWKRYPISLAAQAKNITAQQLLAGYDEEEQPDDFRVVISLTHQTATLFKNAEQIDSSRVSTGRKTHRTPTGQYVITHKHRHHKSSIYNSASMPYFMRLSCGAFGTHSGNCPGYPASHGCIRMPAAKARAFFLTCPTGTQVDIVD